MAKNEADSDAPAEPTTITLPAGSLAVMREGRYFRTQDANVRLERGGYTKLVVVVETAEIDPTEGGNPVDVKTFTLRQFYQNGRPTLDYTAASVTQNLKDWAKWLGYQRARDVENVLRPAIKLFEAKYKGLEADQERLEGIPVLGG